MNHTQLSDWSFDVKYNIVHVTHILTGSVYTIDLLRYKINNRMLYMDTFIHNQKCTCEILRGDTVVIMHVDNIAFVHVNINFQHGVTDETKNMSNVFFQQILQTPFNSISVVRIDENTITMSGQCYNEQRFVTHIDNIIHILPQLVNVKVLHILNTQLTTLQLFEHMPIEKLNLKNNRKMECTEDIVKRFSLKQLTVDDNTTIFKVDEVDSDINYSDLIIQCDNNIVTIELPKRYALVPIILTQFEINNKCGKTIPQYLDFISKSSIRIHPYSKYSIVSINHNMQHIIYRLMKINKYKVICEDIFASVNTIIVDGDKIDFIHDNNTMTIPNIDIIPLCKNVKIVRICYTDWESLDILKGLPITHLTIENNKKMTDFIAIQNMNLTYLHMENNGNISF